MIKIWLQGLCSVFAAALNQELKLVSKIAFSHLCGKGI